MYTLGIVTEAPAVNKSYFLKMAHGDLDSFRELAGDFFADTKRILGDWGQLLDSRDYRRLSEEIHRCKGGASLFGLERIVAMLARLENPVHLEKDGFDLTAFAEELEAAESEVMEIDG